ncbi:YicC/YloC family endoribonuclease [Chondromyces crocatus]|uniref:YicC family protein n=1 Tax=Chondromyces crocatus TaxID=52 RepID=A0A0K1EJJ1_CHOCO|nr:YicC/YloC family endoribonuclease [Chondromyces crocatus]AKT40842.1 uncharacterized protein CMC5_049970 [Chondromyces crocatus]
MTGFGLAEAPLGNGRVVAEIRTVNQRFLDVRIKLPRELADLTLFSEQIVRERLRRGRVELHLRLEGVAFEAGVLDKDRARAAYRALAELRDELSPGAEVPLSLLTAVPELFSPTHAPQMEVSRESTRLAIDRAIRDMDAMCRREGETIAADMRNRVTAVRESTEQIVERATTAHRALHQRMRERLEKLLEGTDVEFDPLRLEAEVALLAERTDITEEIVRLKSHLEQFEGVLLASANEPCGRKLDFLLQEMLREANTLSAKAQDALISQHAVAMKVELERLREQAQNVE